MDHLNVRLVKAGLGLAVAFLIGAGAASKIGAGESRSDLGPASALLVSMVVDSNAEEVRSWLYLDLSMANSEEEASLMFHFSALNAEKTDEVFTIAVPEEFYENYFEDCNGQEFVDRTTYTLNELDSVHRDNLSNLGVPDSEEGSEDSPVQSGQSRRFRLIIASADPERREHISWKSEVEGEEVTNEGIKDWATVTCSVKNSAFWRTVDARRTVILPGVAMGPTAATTYADELVRQVRLPLGAPLIYATGHREPETSDAGNLYWWDQREKAGTPRPTLSENGAEAVFSDVDLQSQRDRAMLWIGVLLGVAASLVVGALSVAFDAFWLAKSNHPSAAPVKQISEGTDGQ